MDVRIVVLMLFIPAPPTRAAVPGKFFWKPRVALDLAPVKSSPRTVVKPTYENIQEGRVVLIKGYKAGLTVAALADFMETRSFNHLNPSSAHYYTNMYRWALRHLSLIPDWLGGSSNYMETHRVWNKRFFFMDKFVPQWLRNILFFVKKEEWESEEKEWIRWEKYAEPAFGKYYKYPSKTFNNYNSMRITETVENLDITNASI